MTFTKKSVSEKKFFAEILTEEFKTVALKDFELRILQYKKINRTFFAFSAYQDSNLNNKIRDCSI